jgi:hypothetical protein
MFGVFATEVGQASDQTSGSRRKITVEVHPHPRAGRAGRRRARSMRRCAPGRAAFFCLVVLGPASSWGQVVPVETSDGRLRGALLAHCRPGG